MPMLWWGLLSWGVRVDEVAPFRGDPDWGGAGCGGEYVSVKWLVVGATVLGVGLGLVGIGSASAQPPPPPNYAPIPPPRAEIGPPPPGARVVGGRGAGHCT